MSHTLRKSFGARLLKLRDDAGLTQGQLSEKSDISIQHIGNLERGVKEPCLGKMDKLAKALGIKLSQLLQDVD